ncbi:hypothetical protein SEPCBS119000_002224 [Sporothrix epigloea]|uniref:Conserved oligomeric Golgi complex subunit 1 n=1 Tax=Sporothrix epigloea TaxID=1892477 RepID=A0ABP0DF16_9PEZI
MAITEPDVGLLTSSAQVFTSNHTLPQIRAIHKSLHVQVDDKATRLRTQVGGSYRELLGTAETIVQMRTVMESAQSTLAGMGGRCGRGVVGGKVSSLAAFVEDGQKNLALSRAARAALLEACSRTVSRLISRTRPELVPEVAGKVSSRVPNSSTRQQRTGQGLCQPKSWGERLLLASKVLVLSRLLLSSMGKTTTDCTTGLRPPASEDAAVLASIEASKKSLGILRRRLRDRIEAIQRSVSTTSSRTTKADEIDDGAGTGSTDEETNNLDGDADIVRGQNGHSRAIPATANARDDLLRALCAHSLATTSGARDVLWQLLHVRSQAMSLAFELDDEERKHRHAQQGQLPDDRVSWIADAVLRGLALYTKTLLDVQALLPHRLTEALLGLKRRALLDDESLGQIEGLQLDIYARWCGEDLQFFKPYIRHDDLDAAQARDMLSRWAERGSEVLLTGLQRALEQQPPVSWRHLDLDAIVDLRTRVLQLWIRDSSKVRGFDPTELLDKMRAIFNEQMLQVLVAKVGKLRLVGSEVTATLASWQDGITDVHADLWDGSGSTMDTGLSDGAVPFVRDVMARLYGRSDAVAKAVASYVTWRHVVDDLDAVVEQLRRQRWDIDMDDIVEDEETIAERQQQLSRDDPQTLQDRLEAALEAAMKDLDTHIAAEWATVARSGSRSASTKGNIAMYLVRVLRELRSGRHTPSTSSTFSAAIGQLGLQIIPELHAAIAQLVVAQPVQQFVSEVLTRTTVTGRPLWNAAGQDTPLPSTPSPGVFSFFKQLSASMSSAGVDLWSTAAVALLKQQVAEQLSEHWTTLLETAEYLKEGGDVIAKTTEVANGAGSRGDSSEDEQGAEGSGKRTQPNAQAPASIPSTLTKEQRTDLMRQWLFDVAWLRCGLASVAPGAVTSLPKLEDAVYPRTGLPADQEASNGSSRTPRQRVAKAAQEHWKRTALLFGLLA